MTRRSKVWLAAAVLFTLVNLAGGVFAATQGELLHTGIHAGLLLLGAYLVRRLATRRYAALPRELTDRLTHLEQSIDAVAIEVERIGEGQRFMTRFFTESGTPRASGEGAAEPTEIKAREAEP
ncbi:MAG: hypothetical protein M3282_07670 [Gemmatimonadota bacterium]|nr:hypothetical protein [Gemmatimonadota bacterium]